jgi:ligand-binding sensor domain-containing protein
MKVKSLYIITFFLICRQLAIGSNTDFSFRHLTIDNGLSNSNVNSIVQDREGFIWIATENGLNKYDGYKFSYYYSDSRDSLSLTSAEIFRLLIDSNNRLWAGTFLGLCYYNPVADNFIHVPFYDADGVINQHPILDLVEDNNKNLWVATSGNGIIKYNLKTNTYEHLLPNEGANAITDKYVLSLYIDAEGRVIAGTDAHGFDIIDSNTGGVTNINLKELFPIGPVVSRCNVLFNGMPIVCCLERVGINLL